MWHSHIRRKQSCFKFVDLLRHIRTKHYGWNVFEQMYFCIFVNIHVYVCLQSYLKISLCPRHLGLSSDRPIDCFPYVPRRRRVLRTPSSLCLSKWGAASLKSQKANQNLQDEIEKGSFTQLPKLMIFGILGFLLSPWGSIWVPSAQLRKSKDMVSNTLL